MVAANASVAITGNLTLEQAKKLAEDITSKLPKGQPATELPEPKPLSQAKHIHIPFQVLKPPYLWDNWEISAPPIPSLSRSKPTLRLVMRYLQAVILMRDS
nr:insulinase family protein [Psychrobacter sp. JCM 18903]